MSTDRRPAHRCTAVLIEALEYLVTPVARPFRGTGYLKESIATAARARRCRAAWAPHLDNCRRVVLEAVAACPARRRCLVFGAGLAHDLPLAALSAAFEAVLLVDVVHLWPVRLSARRHGNVALVAHDVSESVAALLAGERAVRTPKRFLDDPSVDLVVSLNIASQLPVIPLAALERRGLGEAEADALGRAMITAHFDYLRRFRGRVCLVTDAERRILDRDERPVETVSALRGAAPPAPAESWDWEIAPLGEESRDYAVVNRVIAVPDV